MAKSKGKIGKGATLAIGALTVAEVLKVSGPDKNRNKVDLTNQDSPDDYKEFAGGLREAGDVTFDLIYEKAQRASLELAFEEDDNQECVLTLPDGSTFTFDAFLSRLGMETPFDDKMTCPAVLSVSGKPVFAAGA